MTHLLWVGKAHVGEMLTEQGDDRALDKATGDRAGRHDEVAGKGLGVQAGRFLMPSVSICSNFAGAVGTEPTWVGREEQGGGLEGVGLAEEGRLLARGLSCQGPKNPVSGALGPVWAGFRAGT